MRILWLTLLVGCATSPDAPLSSATFSANPMVHSVRIQAGTGSHGGVVVNKWTLTFATIEGCTGDSIATVEIDTLPSATMVPTGAIPLRTDLETPGNLPSAYLAYTGAASTGTLQVDTASEGFVTGSLTAGTLTGTFSAPACP